MSPTISASFYLLIMWAVSTHGKCTIDTTGVICTTFLDVEYFGTEKWSSLAVTSTDQRNFVTVERNTFNTTPNLQILSIAGNVKDIERGAFNGLKRLSYLTFSNNHLSNIQEYMFDSLNVGHMELKNCSVKTLEPNCFKYVHNLTFLRIENNFLQVVQKGVFNNMNIEHLYLTYNKIREIEDGAFAEMPQLQSLILRGNQLKSFESERIFDLNTKVKTIFLDSNEITTITPASFVNLPEASHISLQGNRIQSIENDSFKKTKNIGNLQLNNNSLEVLQPNVFPSAGLPKLKALFLNNNRLMSISPAVLKRLPALELLCFVGNPLVCSCYKELIQWVSKTGVKCLLNTSNYFSGKIPVCIVQNGSNECTYQEEKSDSVRDLVDYYVKQLSEY